MLDPPEEAVGVDHDPTLLGGQAADGFEPREGDGGVGVADLGVLATVEKLQELDDELDIADAAVAGLDLDGGGPGRDRPLLDPPLHRLDLTDLGTAQIPPVDERGDRRQEIGAEVEVARHGATLDQRLPLPGPPRGLVVPQRRRERPRERPLVPFGAEPHVDPVRQAEAGVVGQHPDDLAADLGEELGVGDDLGADGLAVGVVDEDQVDVGAIVQLLAAELAERQNDEPRGLAVVADRAPVLGLDGQPGRANGDLDAGVGEVGEVEGDQFEGVVADDVVVADPKDLAEPEPAEGEAPGIIGRGLLQLGPEVIDQPRGVAALGPGAEPVEQGRVADHQLAEELAGAEKLDGDLDRLGVLDQAGQRRLGVGAGGDEPFQVAQRHPGVGALRQRRVEPRGQPSNARERDIAPGEVAEVAIPLLGVADTEAGEPEPGHLGVVEQPPEPVRRGEGEGRHR